MTDDVARRQTIRELVTAYQAAVAKFQAAFTLIADGRRLRPAAETSTRHQGVTA